MANWQENSGLSRKVLGLFGRKSNWDRKLQWKNLLGRKSNNFLSSSESSSKRLTDTCLSSPGVIPKGGGLSLLNFFIKNALSKWTSTYTNVKERKTIFMANIRALLAYTYWTCLNEERCPGYIFQILPWLLYPSNLNFSYLNFLNTFLSFYPSPQKKSTN